MKRGTTVLEWSWPRLAVVCGVMAGLQFDAAGQEAVASEDEWFDSLLGVDDEELLTEAEALAMEEALVSEYDPIQGELEDALADLNAWTVDGSLNTGLGWRENALNSSQMPVDSFFGQAEVDVFAMKPGFGDRAEYVALLYGDYRHYDDVPGLSGEHLLVAHTRVASNLWDETKGSLSLEGIHSKQAFDASTNDFETDAVTVTLWQPELKGALDRDFGRFGAVQAHVAVGQSRYSEATEDYDTWSAGLDWSRSLTENSRLRLGWERYREKYAERTSRLSAGTMESPPLLKIWGNRWEAEWAYVTADGVFKRSRARMYYQTEDDAAGDFYERDQWELRETLEWAWGAWRLETAAAFGNMDYAFRPANYDEPAPRADESLRLNAELSREIGSSLRAFARYEHVDRDSNAGFYAYDGSSALVGISLSKSDNE